MDVLLGTINLLSERWAEIVWRLTWQGAIFAGIVYLITRVFRNLPANLKHLLWFLIVTKFLIAPFMSPIGIPLNSPHVTVSKHLPEMDGEVPTLSLIHDGQHISPVNEDSVIRVGGNISTIKSHISLPIRSFIFLVWIAGMLFFLANVFCKFLRLRYILKNSYEVKDSTLVELAQDGLASLSLNRMPRIICTGHFTTPLSCGIIRPVILLPEGIVEKLKHEEVKLLLYHELAHIKRMDIFTNLVQLITQVIHFYNPLIWYVNRKIRLEREIACDDMVLYATQVENKQYADTLVKIVELTSGKGRCLSLGIVGISEPFVNMKVRLIEVMKTGRKITTRLTIKSVMGILVLGILATPLYSAAEKKTEMIQKGENSATEKSAGLSKSSDSKDETAPKQVGANQPIFCLYLEAEPNQKDVKEIPWYDKEEIFRVLPEPVVTDRDITHINFKDGDQKTTGITINFNTTGQLSFYKVTKENINKRLAVVVDGKVISAPVIKVEIPDSSIFLHSPDKEVLQMFKKHFSNFSSQNGENKLIDNARIIEIARSYLLREKPDMRQVQLGEPSIQLNLHEPKSIGVHFPIISDAVTEDIEEGVSQTTYPTAIVFMDFAGTLISIEKGSQVKKRYHPTKKATSEVSTQETDIQSQLIKDRGTRQEIWKHQDTIFLTWPLYRDLSDGLKKEIKNRYPNMTESTAKEILLRAKELNQKFWEEGDLEGTVSYKYNYEARALIEIALEVYPYNEELINQLAEIIMSSEPIFLAGYRPRKDVQQTLLALRKKQFDTLTKNKNTENIIWIDFISAYDLVRDLSDDREHKIEVTNWLINTAKAKGWIVYLPFLEEYHTVLKNGVKGQMAMNITVVRGKIEEDWKFGRRPPSFQGPSTRAKNIIPLHEVTPSNLYITKGTYTYDEKRQ